MKILVQARMGSKRLPGKMLLEINGTPLILFLLERLSRKFDKTDIYVLTSDLVIDNVLAETCESNGFFVFRGNEKDVFGRFKAFIEFEGLVNENLVRLTGDNVMIDLNLIEQVIDYHISEKSLFTSTRYVGPDRTIERYLPKGQSIDVFNSSVFDRIDYEALDEFDKEHVIPSMYRYVPYHLFKPMSSNEYVSCSIDTESDIQYLKELLKK